MKRLRTFIAVTPPAQIRIGLGEVIETLQAGKLPIKWEDPQKVHVSLVFLGHITQSRMEAAAQAAQKTTSSFPKFEVELGGLSYFYKRGADSIIYLDIKDREGKFKRLYRELFKNLVNEDFYPPTRFTPHISLGRLKKQRYPYERKRLLAEIVETEISDIGSFMVEKLDVYESLYDPGADLPAGRHGKQRHHLLKSFELSG